MNLGVVLLARVCLLAIAVVLGFLASVTWSRRRLTSEARVFALLLLCAAVYAFGYAGEVAQNTLSGALFWLRVEYLGIPWISALWLLAVRDHHKLQSRRVYLLFVVPAITLTAFLVDPQHPLVNRSLTLVQHGPFWVLDTHRGPIAWVNVAYLYVALSWGAWMYASKLRLASRLFRRQAAIMIAGSMVPLVGHLIYLLDKSPYGLDLSPIALAVTVVVAQQGIFRFRCFDLAPVARDHVFNSMRDAVLVVDRHKRLVDFNPAARVLLPFLEESRVGDDVGTVVASIPPLKQALESPEAVQEIELRVGEETQHFEVRVFPLHSGPESLGWAAILANITAQFRLVHRLRHYAETDALTGIANRRRFLAALEQECRHSARYQLPLALLMIDLDHFKNINDQYGHPAGDALLCTVVTRMGQCLRNSDLLARVGGEEFAVLLPLTGHDGAVEAAERIRRTLDEAPIETEGQRIPVTASLGVASLDEDTEGNWELLLKQADQALYRAKKSGRNRVEYFQAAGVGHPDGGPCFSS